MSKQGVYKISGNTQPKIGETVIYTIDEWYPATPKEKRNPALVTWQLFKKVNGKFVPTNIKKKGISSFTFQNNAYQNTYRIEAYLHEPEGKAPMAIEVQPQPSDVPRINGIQLKYANNTPGNVFNFTEKLIAEAQCTNLEGKYLKFTLWEDDVKDKGHNANNLQVDSKPGKVINGVAKAEFTLTSALMKKAIQGETDIKQLEFYVTVEYYENKKHASENVNINTPKEVYPPSKPQAKPSPPTSQPKAPGSPAAQKGQSQKEKNGLIETTTEAISGIVSVVGKKIHDWAEARGTVKKDQKPAPPPPSEKSPTVVNADAKAPSTCICKEQYKDLVWGGKVSCEFRKKVVQICSELWGESRKIEMANGLMAVMNVETNGSFKAHHREEFRIANDNPKDLTISSFHKNGNTKSSRAVGLIQFTQEALEGMGEFPKSTPSTKGTQVRYDTLNKLKLSYAQMGEINQLDKVKKYFEAAKDNIKSPEDIYLHIFAPKGVGKNDTYTLYESGTDYYEANKSVDTKSKGQNKNDGKIQRSEILERFHESQKEGKNHRTHSFNCGNSTQNSKENNSEPGFYIYRNGNIKFIEAKEEISYYIQLKEGSNEFKKINKLNKNSYGLVKFPDSGDGFGRYGGVDTGGKSSFENVGKGDHYLLPQTAAALYGIIAETKDKGWEVHFGDMSSENGSDPTSNPSKANTHHAGHGHKGKQSGLNIDFRYLNKNGKSFQGLSSSNLFDDAKNKMFFEIAFRYGFNKNYATGKNYSGVNPKVGSHYDHGHIGTLSIEFETVEKIDAKIVQ